MWVSCVWASCVWASCVWASCVWASCVWASCVCASCCVWARGGGRTGGGRDAESKTRTPHKDVGNKTQKKIVSPHVTCPASPQTLSWVEVFFWGFSRFLQLCQSNSISCSFVFLCFLFSCFLGSWEKYSPWQPSIGTAFTPSTFILISLLSFWFWLLSHQRKCRSKNSFITHLFRHSTGFMFYWYAEVLVPHI